jgi:transposase, IS605 OrfB family, central region
MEKLTGIRENFKKGKELNRRFHSLPFRKLQKMVEYKAKLEGIEVRYVNPKNTSRLATGVGTLPTLKEGNIAVLSAVSSTTVT